MNILRSYTVLVFLLLLAKLAVSQPDKPPFDSAVRMEQYANTLEKQRQELRKSALLARFAASREKLSADRYRPTYHFVSPEGSSSST